MALRLGQGGLGVSRRRQRCRAVGRDEVRGRRARRTVACRPGVGLRAFSLTVPGGSTHMRYVYDFAEGDKDKKDLLGGKGANLAEMTKLGLPVPPGLHRSPPRPAGPTWTAARCPPELREQVTEQLASLEDEDRPHARRPGEPAAGLGALRCQVLDARHDGDGPQHRPQRRVASPAWPSSRRTSASPGTPTAA